MYSWKYTICFKDALYPTDEDPEKEKEREALNIEMVQDSTFQNLKTKIKEEEEYEPENHSQLKKNFCVRQIHMKNPCLRVIQMKNLRWNPGLTLILKRNQRWRI